MTTYTIAGRWWLLALTFVWGSSAWAQSSRSSQPAHLIPVSKSVLDRLPEDWRATVAKYVTISEDYESQLLKMDDGELRGSILRSLSYVKGSEDFVLDHLRDPLPTTQRIWLVRGLPFREQWRSIPRAGFLLEEMARSEPDDELALACLEADRKLKVQQLRQMLDQRIADRVNGRSPAARAQLGQEDERWISLENGTMLPGFLRQVPPVFSAKSSGTHLRVLAFGDFGNCSEDQKRVAATMVKYDRKSHFDFGITLGDNFTPDGMHSVSDPRWKSCWEDLYGPMRISFYPSFGNHDWYHPDSPAAEILYSSSTWHMPSPYYTFTAGPVQFFAIDTEDISKAQVDWLTHALDTSQAHWKVVYGHFPPYFASPYQTSSPEFVRTLMPILKGRADVYFAGHYHSLQHLKPVGGVNLFISGGGGRPTYPLDPSSPVALFAKQEFGFAVIETDEHTFTVRFIDGDSRQLYETTLKK